jgi:cell cycle sensor histidine kinase DivJ
MRNLLSWGRCREAPSPSARRPDALRRATLKANARLMTCAAASLMPAALYGAVHGLVLPVLLAAMGLAAGLVAMLLERAGAVEKAADIQVYVVLLVGAVLAVADSAFADFGLAIALLGPIHASLLSGARTKSRAWMLVGAVVIVSFAGAAGILPWPMATDASLRVTGGLAFLAAALIVAHTANRLNTAFEVYDRGQINAFRHLIEHVQDAVLRFSAEGDLLFCSHSSERLLGCKRYELSGPGLIERIHVLDRPAYMTALANANRKGEARTFDVRMRYDGAENAAPPSFVWVEVALSPVTEGQAPGGRYEVVALLRDVTDRRDQENEMRAARKAAEAASEAKSRFLATIGHELRTPLNAIIGFSEMMSAGIGGEPSPTHREYAELIHKSGTHLIGVVGMLLDMSRIEAGRFEINTVSFAPEELIEPCLEMVGPLARAKTVTLEARPATALPAIVADERACRQILINLLSNAIKFSHERGVVTVAMKRQGAWLNLTVADRGIGMSAEAVAHIGEPFFQANDGLARRYEGTGLGLSIVKGLVDLHQGELRISSEPGQGTTMTVLLPINGPETKMPETGSVTPLRRDEAAAPTVARWPEQRRSAK